MDRVLIVSAISNNTETLSSFLASVGIETETLITGVVSAALEKLKRTSFKLVMVMSNAGLAGELRAESDADILLITDEKEAVKISEKMSSLGIFTLAEPFHNWQLVQAINFIKTSHRRFDSLKKEKDGLKKKVEDMKIIDRAKCCLIHYLRIPEATAHRHIEKQAMDMRCTKREVAEEILKKYEN